jgi:hypothetical protein
MRSIDNFVLWVSQAVARRQIRKHHRWLRSNRVVFAKPAEDSRRWSEEYMRTLRDGRYV